MMEQFVIENFATLSIEVGHYNSLFDILLSFAEYPETTITPHPESFTNAAPPYLNSWRSTRHIGTQDESERLQNVLQRIATYCKQRGVEISTTMEQYDKHKMGEITDSQFYRAFAGPKLTEAEMTLLRDKYSDPEKPGLINYLNLVQDLNKISRTNETTIPTTNIDQTSIIGIEEKVNLYFYSLQKSVLFSCSLNNVQFKKFWIKFV
jgi:hypothetical protein